MSIILVTSLLYVSKGVLDVDGGPIEITTYNVTLLPSRN